MVAPTLIESSIKQPIPLSTINSYINYMSVYNKLVHVRPALRTLKLHCYYISYHLLSVQ